MWIRALFCLLIVNGLSAHAFADGQAWVGHSASALSLDYAYLYSDEPLQLSDIHLKSPEQWTQVDALKNYGFVSGEFWIHIRAQQSDFSSDVHFFRFLHPVHDVVDIYIMSENKEIIQTLKLGDTVTNIQRQVQEKKPGFKFTFNQHKSIDVYIRVSGINAMLLTMEVLSEHEHDKAVQEEVIVSGLVYGVLLVMMLYNFGLAVTIRDKAYYFYVMYVAFYILFVLGLTGDGSYYLWPNQVEFNHASIPLFSGLLIIPSLLFPYYLLDFKRYASKLIPVTKALLALTVLYLVCIPIVGLNFSMIFINVFSVMASIFMLGVGIYLSIKKVPIALIYTFAWFSLLLGLAVLPLSSLGFIESTFFTRYSNMFGGMIEAILLSLALAQRIRLQRIEHLHAIEQTLHLKEEVLENKKIFQDLFDNAPIGMFRVSGKGGLISVNAFLARLMGFDSPEKALELGSDLRKLFSNGYELEQKAFDDKPVMDAESILTTADGRVRTCSVTLRKYTQQGVNVIEGFITDISERKQAQEIHDMMEKERMETMEQLVTGVAHEINTPLGNNVTSVSHLTELLLEVDKKMEEGTLNKSFFKGFVQDSQVLMELMSSNLAKMSRLIQRFKLVSVNQVDVEKTKFHFKHHVEYILENYLFQSDLGEQYRQVKVKIFTDGPEYLHSYPAAWSIIFGQLFENSLIHGFESEQKDKLIEIHLFKQDDIWQCIYQDNGQGIAADIKARIFDPFVTSKRGNANNSGLGMYRVYNIVSQVLKGEIKAESDHGFKATIKFK